MTTKQWCFLTWFLVVPFMNVHADKIDIFNPEQQALFDQAIQTDSIEFLIRAETKDSLFVLAIIYQNAAIKGLARDYSKSAFFSYLATQLGAEFSPLMHFTACKMLDAHKKTQAPKLYPDYCDESITWEEAGELTKQAEKVIKERKLAEAKARLLEAEKRLAAARIGSPDGLYLVSRRGVSKISVTSQTAQSDRYEFKAFVVETAHPEHIKSGYAYEEGWWYPATQQIYSHHYIIKVGSEHCSAWGDHSWGFQFKPATIRLGSTEVRLHKTTWDHPLNRSPVKQCVNERIDRNNCEVVRCSEWQEPEPGRYIVRSRSEAIELFRSLSR